MKGQNVPDEQVEEQKYIPPPPIMQFCPAWHGVPQLPQVAFELRFDSQSGLDVLQFA